MKTGKEQLKEAIAEIELTGNRALIDEAYAITSDRSIPEEYRAGKIDALRGKGTRFVPIHESRRREPEAKPNAATLIESQVGAYKLMGLPDLEARVCAGDESAIREAEAARKKHIGRPTTIDLLLETTKKR
jgi:hypothetical protein